MRRAREIAVVALFSSASIASSYAMYFLPNVNLMDLIVFVSAFCLGLYVGASVAAISWLVYGSLNPMGHAGFPLIFVLIASEMVYALAGWLASKTWLSDCTSLRRSIKHHGVAFGAIGVTTALVYDLATNAAVGLLAYPNLPVFQAVQMGLVTMNFPLPLGIIHEASSLFFFAAAAPPLIAASRRALGATMPVKVGVV